MDLIDSIILALQAMQDNVWALTFLALFGFGYMLKEHTSLNNKLIPWVLFVTGMALGFLVILHNLGGIMVGAIMAVIIMWLYDKIKETITEYFIK